MSLCSSVSPLASSRGRRPSPLILHFPRIEPPADARGQKVRAILSKAVCLADDMRARPALKRWPAGPVAVDSSHSGMSIEEVRHDWADRRNFEAPTALSKLPPVADRILRDSAHDQREADRNAPRGQRRRSGTQEIPEHRSR